MPKKKIVTVLGARPQFVKAAVLSRIMQEKGDLEEVIVHTGQHYDANMSKIFFEEMEIPAPRYNLEIHGSGHGQMTGRMLEEVEKVLKLESPSLVVVYGDTNSTLAGALAAKKMDIPVVHVEAGLRSFNMSMPEEVNRILTDRISDLLFCPTSNAMANLRNEGFDHFGSEALLTGDIMKDSVDFYGQKAMERSTIVNSLGLSGKEYVLATIHRQENTNGPEILKKLLDGLNRIARDVEVVLPIHPRTRAIIDEFDLRFDGRLIDPVGYFDMLQLLSHCTVVVTDSGGLQKEAFFCRKPCVILRNETEWVELVEGGFAALAGSDPEKLKKAFTQFREYPPEFGQQLYGDQVGLKMYEEILKFLDAHAD